MTGTLGTRAAADEAGGGGGRGRDGRPTGRRIGRIVVGVAGLLWLLLGLAGGPYQGKLSGVEKNDNSSFLPATAESTKVDTQSQQFQSVLTIPGYVVYQSGSGALTAGQRQAVTTAVAALRDVPGVAGDQVTGPRFSADGRTGVVSVPLIAKQHGVTVQGQTLVDVENRVLDTARATAPPGVAIHSAGAGGLLVAFIGAFKGIDGTLLLAAGLVVILILLVVYRSPVLWFFPLFSAVLALGAASLVIYPLAKHGVITLNGQSQGILSVLVLGAGTDYALLLVSRYREELHVHGRRSDAMAAAWRRAAPAIAASGTTVVLSLLCLSFGELNSDRSLGPVCAIGVACTMGVMLLFLPLFLLVGRWIFWPRVPHADGRSDTVTGGVWGRIAAAVTGRARPVWVLTALVLGLCAVAISTLSTGSLAITDSFTNHPDAVTGQQIVDRQFPGTSGAPAVIITAADRAPQLMAAVARVPGVDSGPGGVCIQTDYVKLQRLAASAGFTGAPAGAGSACAPPALQVQPVGGRIIIDAALTHPYDSPAATATVRQIRQVVHAIPGAGAIVGGQTAVNYDTELATRHDQNLVIPIVLAVILVVLCLLLRAILAPALLVATVVLSFSATLGISTLVFRHLFHFAGVDTGFPLFCFVFLVALGIDYNIFLMTRVREEALSLGTRAGVRRGLAATGGVITSAGVVLAATFAVLGVLPLVALAEIGFAVAFGVLLDTVVVRSILVPALATDIGRTIWWPSRRLAAAGE